MSALFSAVSINMSLWMYQILILLLIINQRLDKISIFLLRDFNINLLNYNEYWHINKFLDSLVSNSLNLYILQPTSFTSHSKTLTDNIFSSELSCEAVSGNITATISDHLPQFLFAPNVLQNPLCNKPNILERENFLLNCFDKNCSEILQVDQHNVNLSIDAHLDLKNVIFWYLCTL